MCITYNMKADILEFEYLPFIIDSDNAILLEVKCNFIGESRFLI